MENQYTYGYLFLLFTHYLHHQFNQWRDPFYNTQFSDRFTLRYFYTVKKGQPRAEVEKSIGKPLSHRGGWTYYSKPADAEMYSGTRVHFMVEYERDSVADTYVFFDD